MTRYRFTPPPPRDAIADAALMRPSRGDVADLPNDPALLWLDKNENTDPILSALTAKILSEIPPSAIYGYPELDPLYRKLAGRIGVEPDQMLLTAGSDGAIRTVFEAYVQPGDAVIHTEPTFGMYPVYCQMFGAKPIAVDYRPTNDGPRLYAEDLIAAIGRERPKLVCLPNPDSPTGTVLESGALRAVVEAAGEAGALMLIDEAYYPFYLETVFPWTDQFGHLVVVRTTAKAWGLAGLRFGYAVGPAPVTAYLHKVRPMYEVNTLAAKVFERLLDHEDAMRASVARLNAGKATFIAAMAALGLRTHAGHGNFFHVDFGAQADKVHGALKGMVYYRKEFDHPALAGFSRFSATSPDLLQPVIDKIKETID
jgi:histidinol-phosphate aminotransferase